jgi:RNA polymerase sigma-70 factor, ECF subfamily
MADDDLATRFVREVVPLSGQLSSKARRLTRSHADVEDLVQETMLKAYAAFGSYTPSGNLHAWLSRIMVNTWISAHRSAQRRPVEDLTGNITDRQVAAYSNHASTGLVSAEAEVLAALPDDRITEALDELAMGSRMVLVYADIQGYRLREIADIMGIPQGTVMSRLHRARKRIRLRLNEIVDDGRDSPDHAAQAVAREV